MRTVALQRCTAWPQAHSRGENNEGGPPARGSLPGGLATTLIPSLSLFREGLIPAHREDSDRASFGRRALLTYPSRPKPTLRLVLTQREDTVGRLVTERSKEVASAASGAGLPSASGCKDPRYQEVLSLPFAPELCSGAFLCQLYYAISDQGLSQLRQGMNH